MPEKIFLQGENVVLEFPDGTPDEVIKKTIRREYPMTGEEVAGHMMHNPEWFTNDITLDEYKSYRKWKGEQSMGVSEFASTAGNALYQIGGEVMGALGELVTSPIDSAQDVPDAFALGSKDLINLGGQIIDHFGKEEDTYEQFLDGKRDTHFQREEYDRKLRKDMKNEQGKINYFAIEREKMISGEKPIPTLWGAAEFQAQNPDFVRGGANVLDPSVFFGGFLGKAFAKAASKVAAQSAGKAVSRAGKMMSGTGDKIAEVAGDVTAAGGRMVESATGMTPGVAKGVALTTGIGGTAMAAGAPLAAAGVAGVRGLQVGGRVLTEAGEGLQRGLGREGFFGGAAERIGQGNTGYSTARGLSLLDTPLEYGATAAGGMAVGGGVGMGLGGLAEGWEGAASGLGGGIALGGIGGTIGHGVGHLSGAALRQKRATDVRAYLEGLPDHQRPLVDAYIKQHGADQTATILDTARFFKSIINDADVIFVDKPGDGTPRGYVLTVKESNGKPTLTVNLSKLRSDHTIGHELFHGLAKIEQMQPMAENIRREIAGLWSEGKLLEEGMLPAGKLDQYFDDYMKMLPKAEREVVVEEIAEAHPREQVQKRAEYVADEVAAEHMAALITGGTKGRGRYDKMLRAFDTPVRKMVDWAVLKENKGILARTITRFADLGFTPGKSMLFPDMDKASPTLNALMRDMIRARKNMRELVVGADETFNGKKLTTIIRKQDLKHPHIQKELEQLGLLKDDGKGGRVMKADKDYAAEFEASEAAVTDILRRGGEGGMRIDTIEKRDGTTEEVVRGSRFSPEQISELQANTTILPHVKRNVAAFNEAVSNGLVMDMNYFAATRHRKNPLTGKTSPRYSSGLRRSHREVLPYKLKKTKAGNFVVKAIDWTKLWTDTATLAVGKKLGLWDNNHAEFLADFARYLNNLSADDPKTSAALFGKDKADFMHNLMEGGGRKSITKDFRLDRMDGLAYVHSSLGRDQPALTHVKMSDQAWTRSQDRWMPDTGEAVQHSPREAISGKAESGTALPAMTVITPELAARFMPDVNDPGYASIKGKMAFPMLADRMKVGDYVGRSGKVHELRGGPDHVDIADNLGVVAWAVEGGPIASQLQKAINQTDGVGLVVLQSEQSVSGNRTFGDIMIDELRYDASHRKKTAIDTRIREVVKILKSKKNKKTGKLDYPMLQDVSIKNLDDLAAAHPDMSFDLRGDMFRRIASETHGKTGGIFWRDVMRKVTDYQNKDGYRSGDIVKAIQFEKGDSIVDPKDVGTPAHPSYALAVKGRSLGNIKGRLSAFQVFRDAFNTMGKEKPGRGVSSKGKVGKNAYRSMQMRGYTDPIFRQKVGSKSLDVKSYDKPLEFKAKGGPQLAELAKRSEINKKLGARHMPDNAAYMKAAKKGDTDTAQRMVDQAAEAAGYVMRRYHITPATFNVFKTPAEFTDSAGRSNLLREYPSEKAVDVWIKPGDTRDISSSGIDPDNKPKLRSYMDETGLDSVTVDSNVSDAKDIIVRSPNQIKSADPITRDNAGNVIPLSERFQSSSDDIRYMPDVGGQDALGMFSAAERATVNLKQERGSAAQMLAMIKKGGVKQEELAELGLDQFLEGNRKVTKDEIIDHLVENQVTVEETVLGKPLSGDEIAKLEPTARDPFPDAESQPLPTKHASYVEPGAVEGSYRELLLRLPSTIKKSREEVVAAIAESLGGESTALSEHFTKDRVRAEMSDIVDVAMAAIPEGEIALSKALHKSRIPNPETLARILTDGSSDYTGGHYGEYPNVLAHVRFNDRVSDHGKTLNIEEIQSDLHQEGRKKGYQLSAREKAALESEFKSLANDRSEAANVRRDEIVDIFENRTPPSTGSVPDFPFKTSWHELAMKRMIKYAVDNGYDAISWTKGETQIARYDLSKQVKSIRWERRPDGKYNLATELIGDSETRFKEGITPDAIEEYVGKDVLERIENSHGTEKVEQQHVLMFGEGNVGVLRGLDLKMGGELHRNLYDRKLVRMKAWKKLGLKVETGRLQTEKNRKLVFEVFNERAGTERTAPTVSRHDSQEAAAAVTRGNPDLLWREAWFTSEDATPTHTVRLTPEVKAKVLDGGLSRFMPDAAAPNTEKNQLGWSLIKGQGSKWRVYKPNGTLAGIAATKASAERMFRTKYKRELRKADK